ncbi:glycoside hydrolase family 25 protein [Epilithonimonas sp. UC225_85]|uniref:glycoside hydrolase family 25 protein n=1 Tax=Epilithonimonas sp. UC225_85 TaxID=3350167 RepID=UPI0036D24B93
MNFISKIVVTVVTINALGLAIVSYKVLGKDLKNKAKHLITESSKNAEQTNKTVSLATIKDSPMEDENSNLKTFLRGIDVSHWNGNIVEDLQKKDGLQFVICKSTQGERDIDPDFTKNWKYLSEKNIMKGTYHFYVYSQDPIKQAVHFCSTVDNAGMIKDTDFPLIIDIEEMSLPRKPIDAERLKKDLLTFLNYVEDKTNQAPIIYSDFSFLNRYLNDSAFSKYPLWLAEYSHSPKPKIPETWKGKGCMIWQKTDNYHVNSDDTDFDIYYK